MNILSAAARRFISIPDITERGSGYELIHSDPENAGTSGGNSLRTRTSRRRRCASCLFQFFTLRRICCILTLIPTLVVLGILCSGIPPSFNDVRRYERGLPQNNATRAQIEGGVRYLRFQDPLFGHGLNNIMQERIMMSQLSYLTNRSYVFEDYIWSLMSTPYTIYDFALRPTRMPLNAFISGPTAGGPMSDTTPRAVTVELWDAVCPRDRVRVVNSKDAPSEADGASLLEWWKGELGKIDETCVEISGEKRVFDLFLFGGQRMHSLWPQLSTSPILRQFTWSPLVHSTILRNFALFQPSDTRSLSNFSEGSKLSGLVAVHLRRGDYKRHCPRLVHWDSRYMGFNSFPGLPDTFEPDKLEDEAKAAYYMQHCLPTVEQLVQRLHDVRKENPGLKRVYVMTNAWGWWIKSLLDALQKDGWDDLASTLDLQLDSEQFWVANAVDMAIGEKAEVFVGNGFSSMTANIVMLRMAKELPVDSCRFL
ncbi:hypothetical protein BDQ12DRAFT_736355 [Crucibulum laeve]|uniref:GDP-fucose protein O-fucosyltransferase-domain-containing protein n=1 Tax=Crucibulum laeve TaxID=68775 RepID=A0A5C3LVH9_9AGAR|nr:hypothetical protein BDQ12DRAFT_736355 [Crucibulum laeve]